MRSSQRICLVFRCGSGSGRAQPVGTGTIHGGHPGDIGSEVDCTTEHRQRSTGAGTSRGDQGEVGLGQPECHGAHPEGNDSAFEELLETSVKKTFQVARTHPEPQQVGRRVLHRYILFGNQVNQGKDGWWHKSLSERNPTLRRSTEWLPREKPRLR